MSNAGQYDPAHAQAPKRSGLSTIVIVVLVLFALCCGGAGVIGVLAAIAIPSFVGYQHQAARTECQANLSNLRIAEKAYEAEFERFLDIPWWPADPELMPLPTATSWHPSTEQMLELGWEPYDPIRSVYQVRVAADGSDFEAHCWIDADNDGIPAVFVATATLPTTLQTGPDVY